MTDDVDGNPLTSELQHSFAELDNELKSIISTPPKGRHQVNRRDDLEDDDESVDLDKLREELNGAKSSNSSQSVSNEDIDYTDTTMTEEVVVDEDTDLDQLQSELNKAAFTTMHTGSKADTQAIHTTQYHAHEELVKEMDDSDSSFSCCSDNGAEDEDLLVEAVSTPLDIISTVATQPHHTLQHEIGKELVEEVDDGDSSFSSGEDYSDTDENSNQQMEMEENRASSMDGDEAKRECINEVSSDDSCFSNEEDFLDEDESMEEGLLLTEDDLYSDEQYQTPILPDPPAFTSLQARLLSVRRGHTKPSAFEMDDDVEYGRSSQLPNVEEYKASLGRRPLHTDLESPDETDHEIMLSTKSRTLRCSWQNFGIFFIFIFLPCILVPLLVVDRKRSHMEEVVNFLSVNEISSMKDLTTPGSPQNKAAIWIANEDRPHVTASTGRPFLDRYVLAVLYFSLGGDTTWGDSLNFLQPGHVCNWGKPHTNTMGNDLTFGVHGCRQIDDELVPVGLSLAFHGLQGELPDELRFLNELEILILQYNPSIGGDLPSSIRALRRLRILSLEHCSLGGSIPSWLGELTELTSLGLGDNRFEGRIPDSLANLTNLEALGLDDNALSGDLELFGDLTNLKFLYLDNNEIAGSLTPSLLQNWEHLIELDLSGNRISGFIPDEIFSHKSLNILDLHGNRFIGRMPTVNVELNDNLEFLALHENSLSKTIPSSISSLVGLKHLDLSKNSLEGTLPIAIGSMMNLRYLFVGENDFQNGIFPQFLTEMESLTELSLVDTGLTGAIPDKIGYLSNLDYLDLSKNQLTGTVPVTFGLLTNLGYLLMRDNQFSGTLPVDFGQLADLELLLLDGNTFKGDLNMICLSSSIENLATFASDCGGSDPILRCSCCTICCNGGNNQCDDLAWEGNLDPKMEYDYKRGGEKDFHGVIFDGSGL